MLDPRIDGRHKAILGGALAYAVSPIDLIPERYVGVLGYLDDAAVMVAALTGSYEVDRQIALEHWSGASLRSAGVHSAGPGRGRPDDWPGPAGQDPGGARDSASRQPRHCPRLRTGHCLPLSPGIRPLPVEDGLAGIAAPRPARDPARAGIRRT